VGRWRAGGERSLHDESSTPARQRRTPPEKVSESRAAAPAADELAGDRAAARHADLDGHQYLAALGLNRLKALEPPPRTARDHRPVFLDKLDPGCLQ
jgi:hypothetical protein